jgi:hypothetical protein
LQLHWNLLDDFYAEAFERSYFFWTVGQQANAMQIEVGQNLRAYAHFALRLPLIVI